MALGDGGNPEQQMQGLEAVSGGNPVVDGEGREQDEAVSGGGLAGVPVEDLVVEVAEEASVVSRGGDLGAEQHRRLGLTATRQAVGDDVPEELPDRRNGRDRIVPGLLGSARVSMARAASWSISGRQPVAWAGNWQVVGPKNGGRPALAGVSVSARVPRGGRSCCQFDDEGLAGRTRGGTNRARPGTRDGAIRVCSGCVGP
ncbi:hypothetical protein ACFVZL_33385 [Streptomyces sp. NPDC058320]|uniref:hypothetical protein n=1 Tax=unclassified Streptomyces TaxID=2593676 RepID=UPI00363D0DC2